MLELRSLQDFVAPCRTLKPLDHCWPHAVVPELEISYTEIWVLALRHIGPMEDVLVRMDLGSLHLIIDLSVNLGTRLGMDTGRQVLVVLCKPASKLAWA